MRQLIVTLVWLFGFNLALANATAAEDNIFREGVAAYKAGNFTRAAELFLALAQEGHVKAQSQLGYMYEYGKGVPVSVVEAARWNQRAA